jgi:hypothetical protein
MCGLGVASACEICSQKRRFEGWRAIRGATQQQTGGGSAKPPLSPSDLLTFL